MMPTGEPVKTGALALIDRPAIERVYEVIKPHIRVTPVLAANGTDFTLASFPLTVKLEHLQHAGSFKARGAFANLLLRDIPAAGVVAASGGNHGAAVAYAAMRRGIPAKIFVPTVSSPAKIERIRACRAALAVTGDRYADALAASETWSAQTGALQVHAFDQVETLLGQGTVGLELSQQAPGLDTILVPVGGGGLIAGIAAWYAGRARIVGVEPEGAPTLSSALQAGRPVDAATGSVAADSLAPRRVGDLTFPIAQAHVEGVVLVTDDAIRLAQRALWDVARLVAEPGGAAAFAALHSGAYKPGAGERVGIIISGGNAHLDFPGSLTGPPPPDSQP
jgi:threonine dehydratase